MHQVRRRMAGWAYLLLTGVGLFAAVSACKNDDTPAPVLSITSISPTSAPVGSSVVITGTAFNATPSSNTVTFGTIPAQVTGATTTSLTVVVPANAGTPIAVTTGGATVSSTTAFQLGNKPVITVASNITASTNWTAANVYVIQGFVSVTSGATLTIEKGTIIKGAPKEQDPSGQGKGGTLIIQAGAKINAVGTADSPIIFTSSKAAGSRGYGDWGGVVLIGKAPHNQPGATAFEGGIPGTIGTFSDVNDNSGVMQYCRIEFAGIALTNVANSEINGLTLYGVGAGTTIDHIQVSYSGDDSYEWFGGTVNMKYLVAFRGWDDDWDTDWGYSGKVQYGVSLRDPDVADQSASNGFESDNFNPGAPATAANNGLPLTAPVFANMSNFVTAGTPSNAASAKGSGPFQSGMHLRRNTSISIFNSLLVGYPEGLRLDAQTGTTNTLDNATAGNLQLRGLVIANCTTPVRGAQSITNDQATTFFTTTAFQNQIIASTDLSKLLLNTASFTLTAPNFLPQSGSPLLTGAIWDGKGADAFFTKETFKGAFGTTDWTKGWTNWDPQNANYDK
ncbi:MULTISPECIES: IPT/TIG domain-containing protein [unclassified Spirosoma]|uniref:IPT/TIG domain-containing protein n=1 Tax=unclassified Spirosoma TaxID=2621999 RepID=UPI0009641F6A|nr:MULTISPECIES: IPT/TIG domain-containing protein [unclassified Spirosoma]MBN8820653.1 IPT/TIG domain-containing protein [Spirosoma sp.]OJW78028.1 MAG: cell shape-determining protein MreB [Spirosoma sp. 48-14]